MRDLITELLKKRSAGQLIAENPLFEGNFSPLPLPAIRDAETILGFTLTPVLERVFGEVANGGFGPSYGLLGLRGGMKNEDGDDAVALYKRYQQPDPEDPQWKWPDGLLPLGHLGCAMYLCIDCTKAEGPVVWFEPNPHNLGEAWTNSFVPIADSTEAWLFAWMDGEDLFGKLTRDT
jgi:hypothetical protein